MKQQTYIFTFLLLLFSFSLAQAQSEFPFSGTVRDRSGIARSGISLYVYGGEHRRMIVADSGGNFKTTLPAGKYVVKPDENIYQSFELYIEISDGRMNPKDMEIAVEAKKDWCSNCAGKMLEVIEYKTPPFPPAAFAVGAGGEVSVVVRIDKEGKVISAKALDGHPLLKSVAAQAVRGWLFSPDENTPEREACVIIVFVNDAKKDEKDEFRQPNRLEVRHREFDIISTVNY